MLLDTSKGDYNPLDLNADAGVRRQLFTFLGTAQSRGNSPLWQRQFGSANSAGLIAAVAQAQLFNNTSWDLWTQDWRVQLVPVSQWTDWTNQMEKGAPDAASTNGMVQQTDVTNMAEYLKKIDAKMAEMYINH
jgi:hypothetical protein